MLLLGSQNLKAPGFCLFGGGFFSLSLYKYTVFLITEVGYAYYKISKHFRIM